MVKFSEAFNGEYTAEDIFPGCQGMTYMDAYMAGKRACEDEWGLTREDAERFIKTHFNADMNGDVRWMEKVEYTLSEYNYHSLATLLRGREYAKAIDLLKEEYA